MNKLPAKQIYLLTIIIVGIIALSIYSTYALFSISTIIFLLLAALHFDFLYRLIIYLYTFFNKYIKMILELLSVFM